VVQRFRMRFPVTASGCRRLRSLLGGRCGETGTLKQAPVAMLDMDLVHAFPIRVTAHAATTLEPQATDQWTLRAGGSEATVEVECVGRPVSMKIATDADTAEAELWPARGSVWFTFLTGVATSGPGLLEFSDVRRIDAQHIPARVALEATTIDDASGSYADDAARETSLTAADDSRLTVAWPPRPRTSP
jgi:hypothetical protein